MDEMRGVAGRQAGREGGVRGASVEERRAEWCWRFLQKAKWKA